MAIIDHFGFLDIKIGILSSYELFYNQAMFYDSMASNSQTIDGVTLGVL